jgi:lipoprotein-anchoring transpeptidase ErfK/SrfK
MIARLDSPGGSGHAADGTAAPALHVTRSRPTDGALGSEGVLQQALEQPGQSLAASRRTNVNTLKSAALLVVLLGVLYGVYVTLSKPDIPSEGEVPKEELAPPLIEYGSWGSGAPPTSPPASAAASGVPAAGGAASAPILSWSSSGSVPGGADAPSDRSAWDVTRRTQDAAAGGAQGASVPVPTDPTTARGGLARSAYEVPASSPLDSSLVPAVNQVPPLEPAASAVRQEGGRSAEPAGPGTSAGSFGSGAASAGDPAQARSASDANSPALAAYAFKHDLFEAQRLVEAGKFRSALAKLTPHYHATALGDEERSTLLAWLDALAGKVIYSREHLLAPPHQVRTGETLFTIADRYHVSHRLLQAINQREVSDPMALVPGIALKVVPGPFRAEVDLTRSEITVFVQDLYGGRFPFTLGDQPPTPGEYQVVDKQHQQRSYYGLDGRVIPANDPANPYGGWWISLGGEVCIHGSPAVPTEKPLGCISLSPQDARDLYSILSLGSPVKIFR